MFRAPKTYPDLATAVEHFHLVPRSPAATRGCSTTSRAQSLREVTTADGAAGWTWKFDPLLFVTRSGPRLTERVRPAAGAGRVPPRRGQRGSSPPSSTTTSSTTCASSWRGSPAAAAGVPFVRVPDAHHHLLLDEPLATVTALRAILATWSPVGTGPRPVTPP